MCAYCFQTIKSVVFHPPDHLHYCTYNTSFFTHAFFFMPAPLLSWCFLYNQPAHAGSDNYRNDLPFPWCRSPGPVGLGKVQAIVVVGGGGFDHCLCIFISRTSAIIFNGSSSFKRRMYTIDRPPRRRASSHPTHYQVCECKAPPQPPQPATQWCVFVKCRSDDGKSDP